MKRRVMAILLAIAMIITMVDPSIFGSTIAAKAAESSGVRSGWSEDKTTYYIADQSDLEFITTHCNNGESKYLNAHYILTADITLECNAHNMINIGTGENAFTGSFDGQGHSISGLWGDAQVATNNGLFGVMNGATVKNLVIKDADYRSNQYGGILAAQAINSTIQNVTIINSKCKVASLGAVVGLITTGGLYGGALVGYAGNTDIYNCESRNTRVWVDTTGGVQALGGDGMYMGGLIGWMDDGTILEYSRVIGGEVETEYYVAVGALAANNLYAGGLVGRIDGNFTDLDGGAYETSKIFDCFSSANVSYSGECYVSVGAGLSGYAGGIAARVSGENYEISRCHFAGNLSGHLLNSVLVLPIIAMEDYYLGGIAGNVEDSSKITYCYFNWEKAIAGNSYPGGPKVPAIYSQSNTGNVTAISDAQYSNTGYFQTFDFVGDQNRNTGNAEPFKGDHINKWVIDPANNMPVHGNAVQAEIDFPGAGTISFAATSIQSEQKTNGLSDESSELANGTTISQIAQTHAEMNEELTLTATVNEGYNFKGWHLRRDGVETAISAEQYGTQETNYQLTVGGDTTFDYKDGDVFVAKYTADVVFENLNGAEYHKEECTYGQIVNTTGKIPSASGYIFLGWSVEELSSDFSADNLDSTKINQITTLAEDNITITKAMHLYPVFIQIGKYNVGVQMESAPLKNGETYIKEATGNEGTAKICTDENGDIYITVENVENINEANGYRFSGWYEISEDGKSTLVSKSKNYYLHNIDLTQKHQYEARYQYRVRAYIPVRAGSGSLKYIGSVSSASHFGDFYVNYNDSVNGDGIIPTPGFKLDDMELVYWTNDVDDKWKTGSTISWGLRNVVESTRIGMEAKADDYNYTKGQPVIPVTAPMEVYGIVTWVGSDSTYRAVIAQADFYSATTEIAVTDATEVKKTGYLDNYSYNGGSVTAALTLKDGYNLKGFREYSSTNDGTTWEMKDSVPDSAATAEQNTAELKSISEGNPWKTTFGYHKDLNVVLMAQITADINMYSLNAEGSLETATLERKYNSLLFNPVDSDGMIVDTENWDEDGTSYTTTPYYTMPDDKPVGVGNTKTDEAMYLANYEFVGWITLTDESATELFGTTDINVIATKKFATENLARIDGYLIPADSRVTETMDICPVYVPYKATVTTNFADSTADSKPVISEEDCIPTNDGLITVTPPSVAGYEFQKWEIVTEDGVDPIVTKNEDGSYTFEIESKKAYTITAVYEATVSFKEAEKTADGTVQNKKETYLYNQLLGDKMDKLPISYHQVNTDTDQISMTNKTFGEDTYVFVGWEQYPYNSGKTEVKEDTLTSTLVTETTAVVGSADMVPVYTKPSMSLTSNIGDKSNATITVSQEGTVTLEAPEQEGYVFTGWLLNGKPLTETDTYTFSPEELRSNTAYEITANYDPVVTYMIPVVNENNELTGEYTSMQSSIPYGESIGDGTYSVIPTITAMTELEKTNTIFGGWGSKGASAEYTEVITEPVTLYPLTNQAKVSIYSNIDDSHATITIDQSNGSITFPSKPAALLESENNLPKGIDGADVVVSFIGYSLVEIEKNGDEEVSRTSNALYKVGDTISAAELTKYNGSGNYRIYAVWSQIQNIPEASIYVDEETSREGLITAAAVNTTILKTAGLQDSEAKYERHILYSKNSKYMDAKTNATDWNNTFYKQYFNKDYDVDNVNWDIYVSFLYNLASPADEYGVCPYLKFSYASNTTAKYRDKTNPTYEHSLQKVAKDLLAKEDVTNYEWYPHIERIKEYAGESTNN